MTTLTDVTLRSLLPHTHLRGKSWEYTAIYPDGRSEVILSVPKYDFNWQTDYVFAQPLKLPKGTRIHAVAHYDNSPANKSNPDPTIDVAWGDQTWEEMMFTGIVYSIDGVKPGENYQARTWRPRQRTAVNEHGQGSGGGRPPGPCSFRAFLTPVAAHDRITTRVTWSGRSRRSSRRGAPVVIAPAASPRFSSQRISRRDPGQRRSRRKCSRGGCRSGTRRAGYGDFANDPSLSPFEIALDRGVGGRRRAETEKGKPGDGAAPAPSSRPRLHPSPGSARSARCPALRRTPIAGPLARDSTGARQEGHGRDRRAAPEWRPGNHRLDPRLRPGLSPPPTGSRRRSHWQLASAASRSCASTEFAR